MISLEQAWQLITSTVQLGPIETYPLGSAWGFTLAEPIVASADSPPFDKAMMDGFAVRSSELTEGQRDFAIAGELTAGHVWTKAVAPRKAVRIMTGAPLPADLDCVIRIEDCDVSGDAVTFRSAPQEAAGHNVVRRGESMRSGEPLLPVGRVLRPMEIGLLAELGYSDVKVRRPLTVAVLATGDELVPIDQTPGPGQIRNSNGPMLVSQIRAAGAWPMSLGIAPDNAEDLAQLVEQGLQADVLCLTGGVSAGKLDLVPEVLAAAGVETVFHKVELRPGKPVWFGVRRGPKPTYVLGLPGNPVSSLVCFELFARTVFRRLLGITPAAPTFMTAGLTEDFISTSDRPTLFPAHLETGDLPPRIKPTAWRGSFDLRATVDANALAYFSESRRFMAGEAIRVLPLPAGNACP